MEFAKRSLVASETAMKGGSTAVRLKQRQATFHDLFQISIRSSEKRWLTQAPKFEPRATESYHRENMRDITNFRTKK